MNLEHLYKQVIMEHYKYPKNKGLVNDSNYFTVHLNNPSCGDEITIQYLLENNMIKDIKHQGMGCSICCSSASIMSETLKGKNVFDAKSIINEFYELVKGMPYNKEVLFGDSIAYQGVFRFPARIKCATLAWKALEMGITNNKEGE